jgi:hypothetical protein
VSIPLSAQYRANRRRLTEFWKLWSVDYVNQLRCRSKWLDPQPNFTEGQVVLHRQLNVLPMEWPLARIERCFPDKNGVIRTVQIRVNGQLKTVPTIHLIYLPVDKHD